MYEVSEYSSDFNATGPNGISVQYVSVAFIECLLAILTIGGNIFVMLAFFTDEEIYSKTSNYYLLNLSASDLLVGFSMVINLSWWITDDWILGEIICKLYMTLDYSATFVSVIAVIALSLDRLQLVNDPLSYHVRQADYQARRRVISVNGCIWFVVLAFYGFIAFGWGKLTGERPVDYSYYCDIETFENFSVNLALTIVEFVIPLTILIAVNVLVYFGLWKNLNQLHLSSSTHQNKAIGVRNNLRELRMNSYKSPEDKIVESFVDSSQEDHTKGSTSCQSMENLSVSFISLEPDTLTQDKSDNRNKFDKHSNSSFYRSQMNYKHYQKKRRAAHRLSILVLVFVVTFMPYYILMIISEYWGYFSISGLTWEIVNLLLWSNSTWNPFIYAIICPPFRRNFSKYLRCRLTLSSAMIARGCYVQKTG